MELFSCGSCTGLVDENNTIAPATTASSQSTSSSAISMIRSSISRRASGASPDSKPFRSRSAEPGRMGSIVVENVDERQHNSVGTVTSYDDDDFHDTDEFHDTPAKPPPFERATSDIYDAQELDDNDDDGIVDTVVTEDDENLPSSRNTTLGSSSHQLLQRTNYTTLPTFARYPSVATKNKNCWNEPPISIFHVRGPHYFTDKKKITSDPYLFQARGIDLFLADDTDKIDLSVLSQSILGGQLRRTPTLAVNFRFPWGFMILYFEIASHLLKYLDRTRAPEIKGDSNLKNSADRTVAKWLVGDTHYKNERLKLIAYVAEGPWIVRNLVTGNPVLIGKRLPVTYELFNTPHGEAPLLMTTLDIGNSTKTAKNIVSVCRRYMSALTVDIGIVIQGETQDEIPEQMLGSIRVHGPDPLKAQKLPSNKI